MSKWYMAGTEGTGKYVVVAQNNVGRVGFRDLNGAFRIRFEPSEKTLGSYSAVKEIHENLGGEWTYPNGQKRFSIVVKGEEALSAALSHVEEQMEDGGSYEINPSAPGFARAIFGDEPEVVPTAAPAAGANTNAQLLEAVQLATQALAAAAQALAALAKK